VLAAKGTSNNDIALKLDLSLRTVKSYLANLFLELNVASRTGAEVTIFRVTQEALNNIKRHSRATEAVVNLLPNWDVCSNIRLAKISQIN